MLTRRMDPEEVLLGWGPGSHCGEIIIRQSMVKFFGAAGGNGWVDGVAWDP